MNNANNNFRYSLVYIGARQCHSAVSQDHSILEKGKGEENISAQSWVRCFPALAVGRIAMIERTFFSPVFSFAFNGPGCWIRPRGGCQLPLCAHSQGGSYRYPPVWRAHSADAKGGESACCGAPAEIRVIEQARTSGWLARWIEWSNDCQAQAVYPIAVFLLN